MKVLWLNDSYNPTLQKGNSGYNAGGWVSALQKEIACREDIQLAIANISARPEKPVTAGNTTCYAVHVKPMSRLEKFIFYYGGYKKADSQSIKTQLSAIVDDFNPDIIQVFGIEDPLAVIIGETRQPVVVHLQGILAPCANAFYPPAFNEYSFLHPFTFRERIARNGFVFTHKHMHIRAEKEKLLFKNMKYCMGRTEWDFRVSRLLSPQSVYYHGGEALRDVFYEKAGTWRWPKNKRFTIFSTVSENLYKGLDFILKTAALLKQNSSIEFEWHIAGIGEKSILKDFTERVTAIQTDSVKVRCLSVLSESELAEKLLDAHVYVHPSYIDNSPNSLCEAQMLGLPVIATYVGGIPSLVANKETGYLVPANAPFELAYLLKSIYEKPEQILGVAANGAEVAFQRHRKDNIAEELIENYNQIIAHHENTLHI